MCLARYGAKKLDPKGWEYELTFHYQYDDDLNHRYMITPMKWKGSLVSEMGSRNRTF